MKNRSSKVVTRAALFRAFASPSRSRTETVAIVAEFMSSSPVPPAWNLASVRQVFGSSIARAWAKHIRHLQPACYLHGDTGRIVTPCVQTAYDFDTVPDELGKPPTVIGELTAMLRKSSPYGTTASKITFVADDLQAFMA